MTKTKILGQRLIYLFKHKNENNLPASLQKIAETTSTKVNKDWPHANEIMQIEASKQKQVPVVLDYQMNFNDSKASQKSTGF